MTDPVFFVPTRRYTALEAANLAGARLSDPGHSEIEIGGIASAAEGGEGMLVYIEGHRNAGLAETLEAAAVFCTADVAPKVRPGVAVLVTAKPQAAFATVGRLMFPAAASPPALTGETGISPGAHVDPSARLEPGVVVEAGAVIGPMVAIGSGPIVAPTAVIGENTKIDNLVQNAHNVRIGRNCLIAGLVGISGSVTVGDDVVMGGGVGIADHLKIGAGAQLAAGSGFMNNVPAGEVWAGYPAEPMGKMLRNVATLRKLTAERSKRGGGNG